MNRAGSETHCYRQALKLCHCYNLSFSIVFCSDDFMNRAALVTAEVALAEILDHNLSGDKQLRFDIKNVMCAFLLLKLDFDEHLNCIFILHLQEKQVTI